MLPPNLKPCPAMLDPACHGPQLALASGQCQWEPANPPSPAPRALTSSPGPQFRPQQASSLSLPRFPCPGRAFWPFTQLFIIARPAARVSAVSVSTFAPSTTLQSVPTVDNCPSDPVSLRIIHPSHDLPFRPCRASASSSRARRAKLKVGVCPSLQVAFFRRPFRYRQLTTPSPNTPT